jgi:bacteriorhodopsin
MSLDAEVICYAILDILAKPVFGFWLLIAHAKIPASNIALNGVWTGGVGSSEGRIRVGDDDEGA